MASIQWEPYLKDESLGLSSDHQAMKFLISSLKNKRVHARWMAYIIQRFTFSLKYK